MALPAEKMKVYMRRLLLSRMRILCNHSFYGLLLMHIKFYVEEEVETAYTDGEKIVFGTKFLESLNDKELDFVLMHEILHVVLQHWSRIGEFEHSLFNKACDIVVNSIILQENNMQLDSITLREYGVSMHLAPTGKEGNLYSVEEIYQMLLGKKNGVDSSSDWDIHTQWGRAGKKSDLSDYWQKCLVDAAEAMQIREGIDGIGRLPGFAKRMLQELKDSQVDWKRILNDFVQEEIVDYSFLPPDRRFLEMPFFLPDLNEKDDYIENILFMIDTSGSMSEEMITLAYSEVKGAIEQFDGKLNGWLGFFDGEVVEPKPFETVEELRTIAPQGGGGTSFCAVFEYIRENMQEKLPISIIILTDGYGDFPEESDALEIPVLWLLNNDHIDPPWGKVARLTLDRNN